MLIERIHMQGQAHATVLEDVAPEVVCKAIDNATWTGWSAAGKGVIVTRMTAIVIASMYKQDDNRG